jgi:hypothetical protein
MCNLYLSLSTPFILRYSTTLSYVTKKSHTCSQEFQLVVGSSCSLDYRSAPHDRIIPPTWHHCYLQSMFDLLIIGLVITLFLFWNIDLYPRFALSTMYNCPSFPSRIQLHVICFRWRVVKIHYLAMFRPFLSSSNFLYHSFFWNCDTRRCDVSVSAHNFFNY